MRDVLAATVTVVLLVAIVIPALGKVGSRSGVDQSLTNLVTLSVASGMYAADWNDRQWTGVVDDITIYGSSVVQAFANYEQFHDDAHPPIYAGWCQGSMWAYWFDVSPAYVALPINFEGPGAYFGTHRQANMKPLHDYLNGRFFDPVLYAPNDVAPIEAVAPLFDLPCEFAPEGNGPVLWSSYSFSPAGMLDPGVLRSNAAGGYQDPWQGGFDDAYTSPAFSAVLYPDLKTHLLEHHWVQGPPDVCNPAFEDGGTYGGCEPYYFNHGLDSSPATLFHDGHVRLLPNAEALAADQAVLKATRGVDGLWHRGTPLGDDGYLIGLGFDGTPLSHHILTTDGVLGRDTIDGIAVGTAGPRSRRGSPRPLGTALPPIPEDLTPEGGGR